MKTISQNHLRELKYMPNYGFAPQDEYDLMYDNGESIFQMDEPIDCSKQFTIILNLKQKFIGYQYNPNDEVRNIIEDIQTGDDIKYKLAINI